MLPLLVGAKSLSQKYTTPSGWGYATYGSVHYPHYLGLCSLEVSTLPPLVGGMQLRGEYTIPFGWGYVA